MDVVVFIWLALSIVISVVCLLRSIIEGTFSADKSYHMSDRRKHARTCFALVGLALGSWLWPIVLPAWLARGVVRTFNVAEFETPLAKWRERQALKIERLEEQSRVDKRRIKELERECEIKEDAA